MGKKGKVKRSLSPHRKKIFYETLRETTKDSRFDDCKKFIQHGDTSVWEHCIKVAETACYLAEKWKIKVKDKELIRGALLHDYYQYDWHENTLANKIHGFTHPRKAMNEAMKDFELSDTEKDMILHHMFPLTIIPPKTKEGLLLCLADKICATRETFDRNHKKRKKKNR